MHFYHLRELLKFVYILQVPVAVIPQGQVRTRTCPRVYDANGWWPVTAVGTKVQVQCPGEDTGHMTRLCTRKGRAQLDAGLWGPVNQVLYLLFSIPIRSFQMRRLYLIMFD